MPVRRRPGLAVLEFDESALDSDRDGVRPVIGSNFARMCVTGS